MMAFAFFVPIGFWAIVLPAVIGRIAVSTLLRQEFRLLRGVMGSALGVIGGAAFALAGYGLGPLLQRVLGAETYGLLFGGIMYIGLEGTLTVALIASLAGVFSGWRSAMSWSRSSIAPGLQR